MKFWSGNALAAALVALLAFAATAAASEEIKRAIAVVHPTEGNDVSGTVEFTEVDEGIRIVAEIHGLKPNTQHGFHVHERGDCSDPKAERAGGHFNPDNASHGAPDDEERHVGDLANIQADENGVGQYERIDRTLSFSGDSNVVGRAVIVHEGEDDLESQPTGDAGARLGCGVIGIAEP